MNDEQAARAVAALDQSKASMEDMADHVGAFYTRLTHYMSEAEALELTHTLVVESIAANDD